MKIEEFILLIIGVLIGTLFGLGFSDWKSIDTVKITNWIIAFGTIILAFIATLSASSWKKQRIPEARKDFINAIVNFDNYIYKFNTEDFISETDKFKDYHRQLLECFWNVEKAIMYYYQFNKKDKDDIDRIYFEIIKLINEFGDNLICNKHGQCIFKMGPDLKVRLNNKLNIILKKSYLLLKLVVGKDITIEERKPQ